MPSLEELLSESKYPYHRLNAFAHRPGCTCEVCWVLVERAIRCYLPGFLPDEPADPRIAQLEEIASKQREEIRRLRMELHQVEIAKAQPPIKTRGLDVVAR
jgi:hypothetical protein